MVFHFKLFGTKCGRFCHPCLNWLVVSNVEIVCSFSVSSVSSKHMKTHANHHEQAEQVSFTSRSRISFIRSMSIILTYYKFFLKITNFKQMSELPALVLACVSCQEHVNTPQQRSVMCCITRLLVCLLARLFLQMLQYFSNIIFNEVLQY